MKNNNNNNILLRYDKIIFPDPNVISNGNYNFYKGSEMGNIAILNSLKDRTLIIEKFFSGIKALASKPTYNVDVEKVYVYVSYYTIKNKKKNKSEYGLDQNTLNNLGDLLSKKIQRKVELRFINIENPYLNRTIMAEYIGKNASMYRFKRLKNKVLRETKIIKYSNKNNILESNLPSDIIGLKITFSGRLVTERLRPRKTVSTAKIGSFKRNNELLMEHGSYTGKNSRGAFTVKVSINHKKGKNYI